MSFSTAPDAKESFVFNSLPTSVNELKSLPEASLDSPYKTAALVLAVLCNFENDKAETFEMLNYLKGPEPVSVYEKQFIAERLSGKYYKSFSFFDGSSPENGYKPSAPYRIVICANPYSFPEKNWAVMHVKSSGADSLRQIKLRCKPSTGQWFLNEIQCLSDIRMPVADDPWA